MAMWCDRCDCPFSTSGALEQHIRDSLHHHECPVCNFDAPSWDELVQHCREEGCRTVCQGCFDGAGGLWKRNCDAYWEHLEDEHVCNECERHCSGTHNLHQHKLSHRAATHKCYCCDRTFKTYSGIFTHLELGKCSSTSVVSLNELAADCRKWHYFIDEEYRDKMHRREELREYTWPYKCPTCDAILPKLSSLFQHIESNACNQTLDDPVIRQLRNYLASRL